MLQVPILVRNTLVSGLLKLVGCAALLAFLAAPQIAMPPDHMAGPDFALAALPASLSDELDKLTVQPSALLDTGKFTSEERNSLIPVIDSSGGLAKPFRADASDTATFKTALHCLTEAIYYEAANESEAGKRAVAQVIINRVAHPAYPSSVCGVVYQGWSDPVCQFSYTCDGSLSRRPVDRLWRQSAAVARAALTGYVERAVGTATHYHADYVLPYWAYRLEKIYVEGRHIFYRFPGRSGTSVSFTARWSANEHYPVFKPNQLTAMSTVQLDPPTEAVPTYLQRSPTDRRAENDVGGRMDPTSGWRLSIPDPVAASKELQSTFEQQRPQSEAVRIVMAPGNPLP